MPFGFSHGDHLQCVYINIFYIFFKTRREPLCLKVKMITGLYFVPAAWERWTHADVTQWRKWVLHKDDLSTQGPENIIQDQSLMKPTSYRVPHLIPHLHSEHLLF